MQTSIRYHSGAFIFLSASNVYDIPQFQIAYLKLARRLKLYSNFIFCRSTAILFYGRLVEIMAAYSCWSTFDSLGEWWLPNQR